MTSPRFACAFALTAALVPACGSSPPILATLPGTDAHDGSTTLSLPGGESTRFVDVLGVDHTNLREGHTDLVALTTEPNTSGAVRVTVHEKHPGDIGLQLRTSVGLAAFVAATTLNQDLLDYSFTAEAATMLDGPSASGLMTAAFLAAMTGARIDTGVTMTGTINPDGTIGPVGGIPEKFDAAITQGKRRLGYPIGMRMATSELTGKLVDVVQLAASRGAEAVEIADVRGAYALMTGKRLPEIVPVSNAEMALDSATLASLRALTAARGQAMAARLAIVSQLAADPATPAAIKSRAAQVAGEVDAAAKQGALNGHDTLLGAWSGALVVSTLHAVVTKAAAGDSNGAIATLDGLGLLGGADRSVFETIARAPTTTLANELRTLAADRAALSGWSEGVWLAPRLIAARRFLHGLSAAGPASPDAIIAAIEPAVTALAMRAQDYAMAADALATAAAHEASAAVAPPALARLATSYRGAASAAIAYLDSIALPRLGEDAAKAKLADGNPTYLFAHLADHLRSERLPADLAAAWGEPSPAWQLLSLASAGLGYTDSTFLVASAYALGVDGDHVKNEDAFAAMLVAAERTARASAHEARIATGAIPVEAKIAYLRGAANRNGDVPHKLFALNAFWESSLCSQTALMLARK